MQPRVFGISLFSSPAVLGQPQFPFLLAPLPLIVSELSVAEVVVENHFRQPSQRNSCIIICRMKTLFQRIYCDDSELDNWKIFLFSSQRPLDVALWSERKGPVILRS